MVYPNVASFAKFYPSFKLSINESWNIKDAQPPWNLKIEVSGSLKTPKWLFKFTLNLFRFALSCLYLCNICPRKFQQAASQYNEVKFVSILKGWNIAHTLTPFKILVTLFLKRICFKTFDFPHKNLTSSSVIWWKRTSPLILGL